MHAQQSLSSSSSSSEHRRRHYGAQPSLWLSTHCVWHTDTSIYVWLKLYVHISFMPQHTAFFSRITDQATEPEIRLRK